MLRCAGESQESLTAHAFRFSVTDRYESPTRPVETLDMALCSVMVGRGESVVQSYLMPGENETVMRLISVVWVGSGIFGFALHDA